MTEFWDSVYPVRSDNGAECFRVRTELAAADYETNRNAMRGSFDVRPEQGSHGPFDAQPEYEGRGSFDVHPEHRSFD